MDKDNEHPPLSQINVLRILRDHPGQTSTSLAAMLGKSPGAAWVVLERLRLSGRATRMKSRSAKDERVVAFEYYISDGGMGYLDWVENPEKGRK